MSNNKTKKERIELAAIAIFNGWIAGRRLGIEDYNKRDIAIDSVEMAKILIYTIDERVTDDQVKTP